MSSPQTAFLTLAKKKTDKLDWVKPLEAFIRREYGQAVLDAQRVALNDLNQLRENVRNGSNNVDELCKYVGMLSSLMMRVPVAEDNVRVSFAWSDSFKSKKTTSFSVFFELACALFNVGVALSNQAASQVLVGDGLKSAAALFQRAAGVFESLKRDIDAHPMSADDLRGDALSMFAALQLAQAQECFFLKATEAKMKPVVLAKLCQQTADYYDKSVLLMESPSLKPLVDGTFPIQSRLKHLMYAAQTQAFLAGACGEAKEFGKQVALLRAANATLHDAKKRMLQKRAPQPLGTAFDQLCAEVASAAAQAEHDNDVIYSDPIPDTLPIAEAKSMVKATPFVNATEFRDPFSELVPYAVRAAAAQYVEKRQSKISPIMAAVDEQNDLLKGVLASLGLPGSLDALDNPRGLPPSLAQRADLVRKRGGVATLYSLQEQRDQLAKRNGEMLSESVATLDAEEERDRSQSGGRRTPSHTLNSALRQEAAKHTSNMDHAGKSDALVTSRFDKMQGDLVSLSGTTADLEKALPVAPKAQSGGDAAAARELRRLLAELDALLEKRRALRQATLKLADFDDITSKLVLGGDLEGVYARELQKFDEQLLPLQATFEAQNGLLEQLQAQNDRFVSSRAGISGGEREKALQRLDLAARAFDDLEQNFTDGVRFHTNFAALLVPFKSKCEQFVNARDAELLQITSAPVVPNAMPQFSGSVYPGQVVQQLAPPQYIQQAAAPQPQFMQPQYQQPPYQQPQYQQPMYGQQAQFGSGPPQYQQPPAYNTQWRAPQGPYHG